MTEAMYWDTDIEFDNEDDKNRTETIVFNGFILKASKVGLKSNSEGIMKRILNGLLTWRYGSS